MTKLNERSGGVENPSTAMKMAKLSTSPLEPGRGSRQKKWPYKNWTEATR
jgi:hypothetical protein